jgi:hypothetical protein
VTVVSALLNHAERAEKELLVVLRTVVMLIAFHTYLQCLKSGRHRLVKKKTLAAAVTVMTALLNHAESAEK